MHAHRTVHGHHGATLGLRRFAAATIAALALTLAPAARATNVTTDVTDIWWPDAEPGWGIQLIQNADVIFATMFVYGTGNQPVFYVALLENPPSSTGVWTGTLFVSHGSFFGAPWNPLLRGEVPVGTMTFALTGIGTGTLDYTVGADSVSRTLNRQPLRLENNDGSYRFAHTWIPSGAGCTASDAYEPATGAMQILHVDPDTAAISLQWKLSPVELCSMSATYSQLGRLGQYQGTLNCPARTGTLTFFEIANRVKGLSGRYTVDWSYNCRYQGRFGGVSSTP